MPQQIIIKTKPGEDPMKRFEQEFNKPRARIGGCAGIFIGVALASCSIYYIVPWLGTFDWSALLKVGF